MLRPFHALRYNPDAAGDLSAVVAPPYDVISEAHRDVLYERSAWNVIRLILNRAPDRYTAAAEELQRWRREGVLRRETEPVLCYCVERFALPDGSRHERSGLMGVVRLEPFESGRIRPHERTFARPKEDRMRILRACRTNLSPIFALFAEPPDVLDPARGLAATRPADMQVQDENGHEARLWLLTEPGVIATLADALAPLSVVIADGHHRYETALAYRDERRDHGATDADAPHNFVLMYLASMRHPGVLILPTHRVLHVPLDAAALLARLRQHFDLIPFAPSAGAQFLACLRQSPQPGRFGLALAGIRDRFVATLNDPSALERHAAQLAPVVRRLDVTLLDTIVLRAILELDCAAAAQEGRLIYTHDVDAALGAVGQGAQAAFVMNPPGVDDVLAVCRAGETMPEKSTYFYPKLLTGLVFHSLEQDDDLTAVSRRAGGPPQVSEASS